MEHLISGLGILGYWETYALIFVYMLIITPVTFYFLTGRSGSITTLLGLPLLGTLIQAFATIFLFISLYLLVYEETSFSQTIMISFNYLLSSGDIGSIIFLYILTIFLLMIFDGGSFDFLIGIIIYSFFVAGKIFPVFPDLTVFFIILLTVMANYFITPIIFGSPLLLIAHLSSDDPDEQSQAMGLITIFYIKYFQTLILILPAMVYLSWITSN